MKFLKRSLVILLMASCFANVFAGEGNKMKNQENDRLINFFNKIKNGEDVTVIALGGSITTGFSANPPAGNGWAGRTGAWLVDLGKKNGSKVTFINQGVSGTDSAFAVARLQDHVISKNPDLVLLEYAMNDQWLDVKVRQRTYEAILRNVLGKTDSAILALFVNERKPPFASNQSEQQKLCKYYNVPYVSWKNLLFEENPSASFEPFFDGEETVHPNNKGHENISGFMIKKLDEVWNQMGTVKEIPAVYKDLPEAVTDCDYENSVYFASDNIKPLAMEGWKEGSPVHNEWASHGNSHKGWQTNVTGAEMTFEVTGTSVGITYCESDQFRDALAWVEYEDGKRSTKIPLQCYVSYRSGYYGWAYKELVNTNKTQKFIVHVQCNKRVPKEREGKNCNITGILVAQ